MQDQGDRELFQHAVADLVTPARARGSVGSELAASELQEAVIERSPSDYIRTFTELNEEGVSQISGGLLERSEERFSQLTGRYGSHRSAALFQSSLDPEATPTMLFEAEVLAHPEREAAFDALSATDQEAFEELYGAMVPDGVRPGYSDMKAHLEQMGPVGRQNSVRRDLLSLLGQGHLADRDTQGDTLMTNLSELHQQPMARGLQGDPFREILAQVEDPGLIKQGARGTCTVTTVEHLLATREPAEYVRLAGGLVSASGAVELRNGDLLHRDDGLLQEDGSGRSTASRVVQASLMEYANLSEDYRNDVDAHYISPGEKGSPVLTSSGKVKSGLYPDEIKRVSEAVLGGQHEMVYPSSSSDWAVDAAATLEAGKTVQAGLEWSRMGDVHGLHALSVSKMTPDYVILRNP